MLDFIIFNKNYQIKNCLYKQNIQKILFYYLIISVLLLYSYIFYIINLKIININNDLILSKITLLISLIYLY
jgi:hypothetical protein